MNTIIKKMKKKMKPGWWKNPDFYIALSLLFYFLFALVLFLGPHLIIFLHGGIEVAQVLCLIFLIFGALCSGIGNWISFDYECDPAYMEEPSEEVMEELYAILRERRRELQEAKANETEDDSADQ